MQLPKSLKFMMLPVLVASFIGCEQKHTAQPFAMPPAEVGVVTVTAQTLPVTTEFPGRLDAVRTAQVRARATGILLKQSFKEGADIKAGDVLFEIDPAPLKANVSSAKANLAKAEASLAQVQARADRYKALVDINAVSKQEYDDATSAVLQAKATIEAAKAAMETAELNLGYATVSAPIDGRIGQAKVTEGTLVSQTEATQLAVIQQLDPIYFDFTQSTTEMLRLRRLLDSGKLQSLDAGTAKVTLILEDGTTYQYPGKLLFSDVTVNPSTGMITLRSEFPNPDHLLLPGMFARGQLQEAVNNDAITVLQRGVALGANGTAIAMIVGKDNKVEARTVKLSTAVEDKWIVSEGLKQGDRVIVEGLQKIRPGAEVKPVPFKSTEPATAAAPQGK